MRPMLTKDIHINDFKNYYWLKKELQVLCREIGISTSGSKVEISSRIETFLLTGEITKSPLKTRSGKKPRQNIELSLDTVITEDHRCSQDVRAFFKEQISPKFHFSTYIQTYFKNNAGKTYRDVVEAWHEEEERKKDPSYKNKIGAQFEYNQFTRDFFTDPNNKGKSRDEAIKAWNNIKSLPGSNKYTPNK
ncbi:DUF6434 domain-containing protein [Oceanobacillus bengalensis]|uniref:Cytoplasmic protein n=1 Tax=Oceanobacillus bengalensis TaxID=1435466 RepID=A0A494Z3R7_9BACI|nr:DUF6434 domain-containing protein [Oceanobacillus bengalensis]RKQ17132.1 cytoplasmic protein [Oceanobacillus bengalensis]